MATTCLLVRVDVQTQTLHDSFLSFSSRASVFLVLAAGLATGFAVYHFPEKQLLQWCSGV